MSVTYLNRARRSRGTATLFPETDHRGMRPCVIGHRRISVVLNRGYKAQTFKLNVCNEMQVSVERCL